MTFNEYGPMLSVSDGGIILFTEYEIDQDITFSNRKKRVFFFFLFNIYVNNSILIINTKLFNGKTLGPSVKILYKHKQKKCLEENALTF